MPKSTLDFKINIKADEEVLRDIHRRLTGTKGDCPHLNDALSVIIQQTLIAAGVSGDFEVEFNCGSIRQQTRKGGGLNSQEWLETGKSS